MHANLPGFGFRAERAVSTPEHIPTVDSQPRALILPAILGGTSTSSSACLAGKYTSAWRIGMSLYRVSNPDGRAIWLAYVDDELRVWSYVSNTGQFHLNRGLFLDFHWEQDNEYALIDVDTALIAIRAGLGTLDPRVNEFLVKRFFEDAAARSVEEVLQRARLKLSEDGPLDCL